MWYDEAIKENNRVSFIGFDANARNAEFHGKFNVTKSMLETVGQS
jgi:hypothetical protein